MIDSHAHYTHKKFKEGYRFLTYENDRYTVVNGRRDEIFKRMRNCGITAFIEPAIEMESNERIMDEYEKYKGFMYPAVGLHPLRAFKTKYKMRKELEMWAKKDGVVAIGEAGLDYHNNRKTQHRFKQKLWFRYQMKLAEKLRLPLILHIRAADKYAIRMLKRRAKKLYGGVVHCFSGDAETAKTYIGMGFHIGVGGMLFKDGKFLPAFKEAIKIIPLDRILLETDAPYVLPDVRDENGKLYDEKIRNTSMIIIAVAQEIARIKGMTADDVLTATEQNAKTLFKI